FTLEPIYEFVDFSFIYKYAYNTSDDLIKKEQDKKSIESGSIVLNTDIHKFSSKHENLVNFVLKNKIMIEDFKEYKSINQSFVKISLIRQIQKEIVNLSKIELYSCIRYFDYKQLRLLLDEYYNNDSQKKGKFNVSKDLKDWLINIVLENIA